MSGESRWRRLLIRVNDAVRTGGLSEREQRPDDATDPPTVPTCLVCGQLLDPPPSGPYPTREEFERETFPAMAMVRAMEVMEVHSSHAAGNDGAEHA